MTAMIHKGYSARFEFDQDDELFVGRLADINDVISFHAETVKELVAAFHEAVDDYIETCARIGKAPEKPYSGKMMLRVDPGLHARAAQAARRAGKSLNAWSADAIRRAAEQAA